MRSMRSAWAAASRRPARPDQFRRPAYLEVNVGARKASTHGRNRTKASRRHLPQTATLSAGSMAFVPRGSTHAFHNRSAEPSRMLVITTPEAIDLIARMPEGSRSPDAMRALFAEHDSQIDGPPLG